MKHLQLQGKEIAKEKLSKFHWQVLLVFSLIFIRYLFFGFQYFYQLDDYIQHHNYAAYTQFELGKTWELILTVGLLIYRPMAGFLDMTLWSLFFEEMIIGVAIITCLYALSALLFYRLLKEFFHCSPLFLVIYTMIPLGFEGTYWMSASTRIIPGLFFTALCATLFHKFCKQGRKRDLLLYFIVQCLSYSFYEQAMVLSITCVGFLTIYHFFHNRKRCYWGLSFLASVGLYVFITKTAGNYTDLINRRTELIFPTSNYYYEVFLPDLLGQLKQSFLHGGFYTLFKGFFRGIEMIFSSFHFIYLILAFVLPAFLFSLSWSNESQKVNENREESVTEKEKKLPSYVALIVGFLLFLAPISMFFLVANPWFGLRNTVLSFLGIAFMIDTVFSLISKKMPKAKNLPAVTAYCLAVASIIASVSELSDYKSTYEDDTQVVSAIYPYIAEFSTSQRVGLLGVEPSYLSETNFSFHEHFHGVTESNWALTGCMVAYAEGGVADLVPLPVEKQTYYPWHGGSLRPEEGAYDAFFYYDHETGTVTPLTCVTYKPEEEYHFYDESGNLFANLQDWLDNGYIYLEEDLLLD
ncbi:MAG: hypothetical protein R3Y63_11440 [Eubacteriales bacterium]